MDSRERVVADVLAEGRVVRVRVLQRLTLTGTGDYFFTVPAPLRDVRGGPGSQSEPGFRRDAVIWQGFASRRRVLAAAAELEPGPAAAGLPLHLELTATVDGRPLERSEPRTGRLRLELKLRNTTAVRAQTFSARPASTVAVRRIAARVVSQVRTGASPDQPTLEVEGPIRPRTAVVAAPLVVAGEVRLPARGLDDAVVTGGSLVRRPGGVGVRFRLVLAGPRQLGATISLTGAVRDAVFPRASLTAKPSATAALANGASTGPRTVAGVARLLLRLARVRQYDAFLANPAPAGSVQAVYSFRTVEPLSAAATASASNEGGVARPLVVLLLALLGAGGLAVLWAHL